eukprot:362907-Chlamydomonas_euryale.AAC.3
MGQLASPQGVVSPRPLRSGVASQYHSWEQTDVPAAAGQQVGKLQPASQGAGGSSLGQHSRGRRPARGEGRRTAARSARPNTCRQP